MKNGAPGDRPRRYFLVERYIPSVDPAELDAASARLDRTTEDGARHLATVLIPDEETCLSLFEAPEAASVEAANGRAGFEVDRIVEVRVFGVAADTLRPHRSGEASLLLIGPDEASGTIA